MKIQTIIPIIQPPSEPAISPEAIVKDLTKIK